LESKHPKQQTYIKKEVAMNGVSTQTGGGTGNKSCNKGGRRKANKFGSIIH